MMYALPTIDNRSTKLYKTENETVSLSGMEINRGTTNLPPKVEVLFEKVSFARLELVLLFIAWISVINFRQYSCDEDGNKDGYGYM